MSHITWPGTLPQFVQLSARREIQDGVLKTKMDAGPDKMRPKYTAVSRFFTTNLLMTGEQYEILDTFYRTTSELGTHPFSWEDPIDNSTQEFRFANPPSATLVQGDVSSTPHVDADYTTAKWNVSLRLERLP